MLKPFSKNRLSAEERIFNYRLSRARRVIENTFGILGSKWRIYRSAINASLELTEKIIKATVCLHNWLRNHQGHNYVESNFVDKDVAGKNFRSLTPANHNASNVAKETRKQFCDYFVGTGAVEWQNSKI